MDLTKLLEEYLSYLKEYKNYSPHTLRNYKIAIKQALELSEIEQKEQKIVLNIMPYRLHIASLAKRTIYARVSSIKNFVKYLQKFHKLDIILKGDQHIKIPSSLPKPLRSDDITKVLESADEQTRLIIKMLYGLGLRISELASLELNNISKEWVRVYGKGSKEREVPLIGSLFEEITRYKSLYAPKKYLFEKDNKALSDAQMRYKINKAFARFGIKATPHQLRHSFASHLLQEGARISDVSELLGHASMATTQIYTKLSNKAKLENYLKAHPLNQKRLLDD